MTAEDARELSSKALEKVGVEEAARLLEIQLAKSTADLRYGMVQKVIARAAADGMMYTHYAYIDSPFNNLVAKYVVDMLLGDGFHAYTYSNVHEECYIHVDWF